MFITKQLEDLARKLYQAIPENAQSIDMEIQQQFNEILKYSFAKLDLVTREEFDVQVKVLARTREKVEKLELELSKLTKK